jgi:hypothetical protein
LDQRAILAPYSRKALEAFAHGSGARRYLAGTRRDFAAGFGLVLGPTLAVTEEARLTLGGGFGDGDFPVLSAAP